VDVRVPNVLIRLALLLAAALCLIVPSAAAAAPVSPPPVRPDYIPATPATFEVSGEQALRTAGKDPVVAAMTRSHGQLTTAIQVTDDAVWQVGYTSDGTEVAQVKVDGVSGAVTEAWTGFQVAWPMARGYSGQFGHILNAPFVWIPLALLFLVGLFDFRRPLRFAHLDLLVLLSFGISQVFFNNGEIGVSAPLAYPPLVYLFARMLWIGFRGNRGGGLRPSLPWRWIGFAVIVLVAFRITINIADSGVIDVGYAGTIGADRITHGETVWGEGEFPDDNRFGDTYGPANYYAYVPFELALPWSGSWDQLPASHAAAIAFDLATVLGLFFCGLRLAAGEAGRRLGTLLAFAWVAYPYSTFALQANSNDSLLAAFLAWSLALFAKPLARGALLAAAVMTKFAPLALAPLYAAGNTGLGRVFTRDWRSALKPVLLFVAGFLGIGAVLLANPAVDPGLATFFDRTVVSQVDRTSPFSIWGQVGGIQWLQTVVFAAVSLMALAFAFVPRRRSLAQVAALSAAVLIGLQLAVDHWFYLYIPWFLPGLFVALLAGSSHRSVQPS
jgi:Glycosyltransferase family 87